MTIDAPGSYTLAVTFQLQQWDGAAWQDVAGSTDQKTATLTVSADATQNSFSVDGGLSQTVGNPFTITATGLRQHAPGTVPGEQRYIPTLADTGAGHTAGFALNTDGSYTAQMSVDEPGTYTLAVTFQLQQWDGTAWQDLPGRTDQKTATLTVNAAAVQAAASPQTGDGSNLPLWAALGAAALAVLALCGVVLYRRRRQNGKAG